MKQDNNVVPMILSTPDNPYNPFGDFDNWYAYDEDHGYHTSSYVARLTFSSDVLSDTENQIAVNNAIRKIYECNPKGMYVIYYEDGRVEKIDNELSRSLIADAKKWVPFKKSLDENE